MTGAVRWELMGPRPLLQLNAGMFIFRLNIWLAK